MPMPEASMNENDLLPSRKNKIWIPWQCRHMEPVSVTLRVNHPTDDEFWFRVFPSHEAHPFAALGGG